MRFPCRRRLKLDRGRGEGVDKPFTIDQVDKIAVRTNDCRRSGNRLVETHLHVLPVTEISTPVSK
jgi:hypothetical protein